MKRPSQEGLALIRDYRPIAFWRSLVLLVILKPWSSKRNGFDSYVWVPMLTREQEERGSNQFSHQVNLVAKRCKLCTAEMSLRVSLLSKKYLLVTQPLHKREKVQVKPNPDCYQPRLGSFLKFVATDFCGTGMGSSVSVDGAWRDELIRNGRSYGVVVEQVWDCTFSYKESRLICLCR